MSETIKGITIEFRGNATPLQKAIRTVNSEISKTAKELTSVNKALKFNPTSVDLWKQKQELLTQKVKETEEKLKALKQAQKQMDAEGVDKNSEEYRKLQREIIETESKLKTFKSQLREVGNYKLKALSEQFKEAGSKLESAGQSMREVSAAAAVLAGSIGAVTVKSAKWADEIETMSKKYSIGTDKLQLYAAAAELVDTDVNAIAKSHVRLEKSMYSAQKGTGDAAKIFDALGVSITNADGSLRDSDAVWQDTISALGDMTNETERDAYALTLMGRSAAELNPLIEDGGEAYKNLVETMNKYGLDFIDEETLQKANEFKDEMDTIKAIGAVAFQSIGAQLAGYLVPALEKVVDYVGRFANWLTNLDPKVLTIITAVAGLVAVLAPALIVLGKIASGVSAVISVVNFIIPLIGTLITGIGSLAAAMGAALLPILPIIAAIAALIAVGVLLYKNWDKIKAKASEMWKHVQTVFETLKNDLTTIWTAIKTAVTTAWNGIKNAIVTPITNTVNNIKLLINLLKAALSSAWASIKATTSSTWNAIKNAIANPIKSAIALVKAGIDKLKSIINGAHFKLPHIKLPHFKVSGKLSLNPPSVPKVNIDWYKTGGIFNSPTIAGIGEAGPEAVVPLDKFWDKLDKMQGSETNIVININGANKDPHQIAEEVKRMLIQETNRQRLAWQ